MKTTIFDYKTFDEIVIGDKVTESESGAEGIIIEKSYYDRGRRMVFADCGAGFGRWGWVTKDNIFIIAKGD